MLMMLATILEAVVPVLKKSLDSHTADPDSRNDALIILLYSILADCLGLTFTWPAFC